VIVDIENDSFGLAYDVDHGRVSSFMRRNDEFPTNYVKDDADRGFGEILLRYSLTSDGEVHEVRTPELTPEVESDEGRIDLSYDHGGAVGLGQSFASACDRPDRLVWRIRITNTSSTALRIHDLGLPLVMNTHYVWDTMTTYTERVIRHSFISGQGSFLYWCRPNGVGPYLLMIPTGGTGLEYYDREPVPISSFEGIYSAYIHSERIGGRTPGTWRQPHTGRTLQPGESAEYGFDFLWVEDHFAVRGALYENDLPDIIAVPGMTLPRGMDARLAIRIKDHEPLLTAEFPERTTLAERGRSADYRLYDIAFELNGENLVTLEWGPGKRTYLEFFSTHPVEELLDMRTDHVVRRQQYRGEKWYDGLMSIWDMRALRMGTPDDDLGIYAYCVSGADDPGLGRAPFVAYKNTIHPNDEEIRAVEYYIEHFVWGKLQRTDDEHPYPCGIYGSDSWYENRNSGTGYGNGGHGMERMWRTFDYTHLIQLYFMMYRIARLYPERVRNLDAKGYLRRAYLTAKAFYEVPYSIFMRDGWSFRGWTDWAFKQGNFHERFIPEVIDALAAEGLEREAGEIKQYWEIKVKYMVYDHPYPFGSEMHFDSTAFESTHAIAQYGLSHDIAPDVNGFYDKNLHGPGEGGWRSHEKIDKGNFVDFMEKEIRGNLACRASIEPQYYMLGSDFRQQGNTSFILTYMTQLGGWAIMDYALHYSDDCHAYMRLGYASYLAALSLINTGADYPWWPSEENRGACGWVFSPEKYGWRAAKESYEEPWRIDGEMDNGLTGTLQTARTTLCMDDIFGPFAFCGRLTEVPDGYLVVPMDGVRQRFSWVSGGSRKHFSLDRDGFTRILTGIDGRSFSFDIDNGTGDGHETVLTVTGAAGAVIAVNGMELGGPLGETDSRSFRIDAAGVTVSAHLGSSKAR